MESDSKRAGVVFGLLIALVIGAIIGYALHKPADTGGKSQVKTAASDLRSTMRSGLQEHAALAAPLIKAQLTDSPDVAAAEAAMEKNSMAIADAVDSVYSGKKDEFLTLWRQHLGYYKEYVAATKADDDAAKQTARDNLAGFADKFSTFLNKANSNLDKNSVKEAVSMHGNQTLTLIDQLAAQDFTSAYNTADEAYMHMGDIADTLAAGIVKQFPDKF